MNKPYLFTTNNSMELFTESSMDELNDLLFNIGLAQELIKKKIDRLHSQKVEEEMDAMK